MIKKILLVDNNPVILKMLTSSLEKAGYQVKTALNGLSAFDLMLHDPPDIVFLDLIMPKINGEQLCRIINDYEQLRDIPIVLVSGVAAEADHECMLEGAAACIAKGPELSKNVLAVVEYFKEENQGSIPSHLLGKEGLYPREISLELLDANRHLQIVMENMSEGILELTPERRIIFANRAASFLTGIGREKLLTSDFFNLSFEGEGKDRLEEVFRKIMDSGGVIGEKETLVINDHLVKLQFLPVRDREEETVVVIIKDITARKEAEKQILESHQYFHAILNSVQSGILIIDVEKCTVIDANPLALEMLAIPRKELTGKACQDYPCTNKEGGCPLIDKDNAIQTVQTLVNGKGERIDVLKTATTFEINKKFYIVESFIDISEQKRLEKKLHALTITDELTGLLNRRGFMMMAKKQLSIAARVNNILFLVFADLDDLKLINDTFGHETGDKVLTKVGEVLKSLRSSDISARLGGDEFVLLITGDKGEDEKKKIVDWLKKLFDKVNEDIRLATKISLSIGIVEYDPQNPRTLEELLSEADALMYKNKMKKERNSEIN